jgi:hypothetical protein
VTSTASATAAGLEPRPNQARLLHVDGDVAHTQRLEAGERDVDDVGTARERRDDCVALVVGHPAVDHVGGDVGDRDVGPGQGAAGAVLHENAHAAGVGLGGRGRG